MNQIQLNINLPTYNRKEKLEECLKVLLNQSYPKDKYEIIVVDDGSTDGTKEIITEFKDNKLRYQRQENKGPGAAINTGAKMAMAAK